MWVKQSEYIALVSANAAKSTTIEWMRQQINQLNQRCAILEAAHGLPPIAVPEIVSAEPQISDNLARNVGFSSKKTGHGERPSDRDIFSGNISFEDMGDELAQKNGIGWDPQTGTVKYN